MYDDMIHELTEGKPFVFVAMKYGEKEELYKKIKDNIRQEFGLACVTYIPANS